MITEIVIIVIMQITPVENLPCAIDYGLKP